MADSDIPMQPDDIRFEERGNCLVLVDPVRDGSHDIGAMWPHGASDTYAARFNLHAPTGEPLPVLPREAAMTLLLDAYRVWDATVITRLEEQKARFSFGFPQIVKT